MVTKLLDDVARSEATEIRRRVATIASKAEEDERRCVQPVQHTDGITYTRCMTHMEITDEPLGLAKTKLKAKPAKGPTISCTHLSYLHMRYRALGMDLQYRVPVPVVYE